MASKFPEAHITGVSEKGGCLFVKGVVNKGQGYLKAEVTIRKADVLHMSDKEFRAFMERRLPEFTADIDWNAEVARTA